MQTQVKKTESVNLIFRVPIHLKNKILDISNERRKSQTPNASMTKILIELIEKGLSMVQPLNKNEDEVSEL